MIKFGTGGWRAIIADEFTKANVRVLIQALCDMIYAENKQKNGVCIGYDRRFLSKEAAHWAAEVFAGNDVFCRLIDREAPTPLIMYMVKSEELEYGLAITASHNPAIYNGIKIFTKGGRDADEIVTAKLERYIEKIEAGGEVKSDLYSGAVSCKKIVEVNTQNDYIDSILGLVNVDAIKKARLKIALDPMYGVSQTCLQTILLTTRCEVRVIHERHDTLFGGRLPAPNENTLEALKGVVLENGCDLGIATDGDADRLGVIDNEGEFVHPNKLMSLLYYYLLEYRKLTGAVVRNNSTTHLLDGIAAAYGEQSFEVPVGFKHISSQMEKSDALIGGESSGGLTVKGHILGKDGIYAAALLAEMTAVTGKRLSQLYREITDRFGKFFTADADITLEGNEHKAELAAKIFEDKVVPVFPYEVEKISYLDGCKVYFKNGGWIIARFSGTEPILRLCCEMDSEQKAKDCINMFKKELGI